MKRPTHPRLYSAEEFKVSAQKPGGEVLPLIKQFSGAVIKAEGDPEGEGPLSFILSTASPDRSNDVVMQDGWRLDNYRKNPVMLWAHDYSQRPVAKSPTVFVEGGQLVARGVEFVPRDLYELGWSVGQLYRKGFMSAVSVGFQPVKFAWNEERGGMAADFMEQELLEFSAVPVPANPEALISAKSAGIPVRGFIEWAARVLDEADEDAPARAMATGVWKALAPKQVQTHASVDGMAAIERLTKAVEALTLRLDGGTFVPYEKTGERRPLSEAETEAVGKAVGNEIFEQFKRHIEG